MITQLNELITLLGSTELAGPSLMAGLVALSGTLSVIMEVLKKLPKVPVDSDNATVVILGLATISVLTLSYLDKALTLQNADAIVGLIVTTFGLGVGLYKLIKPLVLLVRERLAKYLPSKGV
jgi:hypothetical protein